MDPALWELLRDEKSNEREEIEAIIRLDQPHIGMQYLRIVSRFGPIATCRLEKESIIATHDAENVLSLKAARILSPEVELDEMDVINELPLYPVGGDTRRPSDLPLTGTGVVIGIADWGCDFDHPNFKHPDGSTRILALWDQRGRYSPEDDNSYGYGTIYSKIEIDHALRSSDPYAALGYHPAGTKSDGSGMHGTHVMDIAAGNGLGGGPAGLAPEADLVFVHLANRNTSGLANLGDSVRILEAVDFIVRNAGDQPWVINLSVGNHGGPHDGSTLVEMAFDYLLRAAPGRFIVQSTGNYFDKMIHASGRLREGQERTLHLLVDEADFTPNELEIWYSGTDEFSIQVESPIGTLSPWVELGEDVELIENGRIVGRIYNRASDPNNLDNHVDLFLYPDAPPGSWQVTIQARSVKDGTFHAWLERDEACAECQTHFTESDTDNFYTTGTLANGQIPLVVGAYDAHSPSREVAYFSSVGPTRGNQRSKPDLAAPGVGVLAARSLPRDWHNNPGLLMRKSGTSMAAPHVTGAVALCLQGVQRPLWSHEIRELILNNSQPVEEGQYQPLRYGHGYLDIDKIVRAVLATSSHFYSPTNESNLPEEYLPDPKEIKMEIVMDKYLDQLEKTIGRSGSRADSERNLLTEILRTNETQSLPISLDPDQLYRGIVFDRKPISEEFDEYFTVLARPGESPKMLPRAGDIMVRVALGEPGLGHVAVISDSRLWPNDELENAPFEIEHSQPGFYATVIEGGAHSHNRLDPFARLIFDSVGRMPSNQILLRIKSSYDSESIKKTSTISFDHELERPDEDTEISTRPYDGGLYELNGKGYVSSNIYEEENSRHGWKKTNIQFRFQNYRDVPLKFYLVGAFIIDIRTGKKVLLGESKPQKKSNTGTLGVVSYPAEYVPTHGSMVLNLYPIHVKSNDGKFQTKGEFVGGMLEGSFEWYRSRRDMLVIVSQDFQEIFVKARSSEEAQKKIEKEGKIGLVLGPVKLEGGGNSMHGNVTNTGVELEYKVKIALNSLSKRNIAHKSAKSSDSETANVNILREGSMNFLTAEKEGANPLTSLITNELNVENVSESNGTKYGGQIFIIGWITRYGKPLSKDEARIQIIELLDSEGRQIARYPTWADTSTNSDGTYVLNFQFNATEIPDYIQITALGRGDYDRVVDVGIRGPFVIPGASIEAIFDMFKIFRDRRKLFKKYIKKVLKPSTEMISYGALVNIDIGRGTKGDCRSRGGCFQIKPT